MASDQFNQIRFVWRDCDRNGEGKRISIRIRKSSFLSTELKEKTMEQGKSTKPGAGDAAPELRFLTRGGDEGLLSNVWKDGPAFVLWLRHLG